MKKKLILVCAILMLTTSTYAECPSADLTGDCFVDFQDFVVMASQWMTGKPDIPQAIVWVYIDDPGIPDHEGFTGKMSKHETTNAQYCQFLNAALASGDITVEADDKVYGAGGSNSGEDFVGQTYYDLAGLGIDYSGLDPNEVIFVGPARISYSGSSFTVDSGFDDHPVAYVTWYGATAFCNYYGYRLPTEWEWQAVADYDGSFIYGCGTSINNSIANYEGSTHPDGTTAVGSFGSYGYGLNDMAGNIYEWTSSLYDPQYGSYILRGGSWYYDDNDCSVSGWNDGNPDNTNPGVGFRVCLAEPEPVANWRMDETDVIAGSFIADSSGWDNDGIARDEMVSVSGVIGGALHFDGSSDSIDLGTPAKLDFGTGEDASFAFWIKTGTTSIDRVYWKVNGSILGFTIFTQADGTIRCLYGDGVNYAYDTDLISAINDDAWHCVVIVIDTVNDEIRGYLEGVLDGTLDISSVTGDVSGGGTAYIGSKRGSTDFLIGSLDEFTIFDKALSQEEIATYYNSAQ